MGIYECYERGNGSASTVEGMLARVSPGNMQSYMGLRQLLMSEGDGACGSGIIGSCDRTRW